MRDTALFVYQRRIDCIEEMYVQLRLFVLMMEKLSKAKNEDLQNLLPTVAEQSLHYYNQASRARLYMDTDLIKLNDAIFDKLNAYSSHKQFITSEKIKGDDFAFLIALIGLLENFNAMKTVVNDLNQLEDKFRENMLQSLASFSL